jgi:hypothetical protein
MLDGEWISHLDHLLAFAFGLRSGLSHDTTKSE